MARKKQEPKPERELKVIIDPNWDAWLHNSEQGRRRLLEAQALLLQNCAEHRAEALPDGEEKQQMLHTAELLKHLRPSVQNMDRMEHEQRIRLWEAEKRLKESERRFLTKELNRMNSLSEPIFILELPDDIIQKLIAAAFDSVGKLLFGVQVATQRIEALSVAENWGAGLVHSRDFLINAVGQEGYNLIGSRLIQFGYLQRGNFLSELKHEMDKTKNTG